MFNKIGDTISTNLNNGTIIAPRRPSKVLDSQMLSKNIKKSSKKKKKCC